MPEEPSNKLIALVFGMIIEIILNYHVVSPILGWATGTVESAGFTMAAAILTAIGVLSDIPSFNRKSF